MKIRKLQNVFSGEVNVKVPKSWEHLNQKELKYILLLLSQGRPMEEVKKLFFLRKGGFNPVHEEQPGVWKMQMGRSFCFVRVSSLVVALDALAWMDEQPLFPLRLKKLHDCKAVDAVLHDITFADWLSMDNLYQGFILSKNTDAIRDMSELLYPGIQKKDLNDLDLFAICWWYGGIKAFFSRKFSHLFSGDGNSGTYDPEQSTDNLIRALTGGDVLKNHDVLYNVDVWAALKELNQKAKEAHELSEKMK